MSHTEQLLRDIALRQALLLGEYSKSLTVDDPDMREVEELGRLLDAALSQPAQPAQPAEGGQVCRTCESLARTVMMDQSSHDQKPAAYGIRQITDDESVEEWEDIRTSPDVAREEADDMMATGRGERYEVVPLYTTPPASQQPAPAVQAVPDDVGDRLFRLLNGAAGDGLVINDVDAAELFCDMFPEHTAMLSASPAAKEGGE